MLAPLQIPSDTSVLRQGKLIGRQEQLDKIKNAIQEKDSYVFFFTGEGGIGKTRLLQEIGQYIKTLPGDDENFRLLWSGIIDLYHSDMHSNSRIEQALIAQLDENDDFFQEYEQKRQTFEKQRLAGLTGSELEKSRLELTKAFVHGFEKLTKTYRVVLAFDTLELVQYESSVVRELCEVEEETSSVKNWLLEQIGQMKNTVTIFAGRPHSQVQSDFFRHFQDKHCYYEELHVERFEFEEAREYLYELAKRYDVLGSSLNGTTIQQIYQGADNGRPIYISLAADLLSFGEEIGDLFPLTETVVDEAYLKQLRQYIARRLLELPGIQGFIVRYLAIARQGLDESLLFHLLEGKYTPSEIRQAMEEMKTYTFVKIHPHDPAQLFLHDEVYDILDEFHLDDRTEVDRVYKRIRDYYDNKRKTAVFQRDNLGPLTDQSEADRQTYEDLLHQIADLTATTLYYELQVDPLETYYRKYIRWDEEAITAYQVGYDMRLRDVVLAFFNTLTPQPRTSRQEWLAQRLPRGEVNRMNAILWLRRYLARGQNEKCYRIANKLGESKEPDFEWDRIDDDHYKAALLTMMGEAMLFMPAMVKKNTLTVLDKAIAILEPIKLSIPPEKDERDLIWRRARILGRAYNNKALVYRFNHQYSTAVPSYRKAIALYRLVDIRDEMANSINNLSYVYAQLGALHEAEALAKDALNLRAQLWQRYPLSHSYNTLGEVHIAAQHPHQARGLSTRALQFASSPSNENTGFARGQALAQLSLGKSFRGIGALTKNLAYSYGETIQHYEKGRDYLQLADAYFDKSGTDYEVKVKAEMGRLYRDWMSLNLQFKDMGSAQERKELAVGYLNKALVVAEKAAMIDEKADILEDLARLHWILKDRDTTWDYLNRAENQIPAEYKPQIGVGLIDIAEPINPLWVILGKIYLLRAEIIFNTDEYTRPLTGEQVKDLLAAMEYRVLAAACFEKFSPYANSDPQMKETKIALYNSLKRYGVPRLQLILDRIHQVEEQYKINIDSILDYINKTMGFYLFLGE